MRQSMSVAWFNECRRVFRIWRDWKASPLRWQADALYMQGYTAKQAGRLLAVVAKFDETGDKESFVDGLFVN